MDDLISRQAAIEALGEKPLVWDDFSDFDLGKAAQWSDDVDAIKELPSAEPQRIKGRWIRDDFGSFCESCGLYAYLDKFGEVWESNYCPNCGADMRGNEDG